MTEVYLRRDIEDALSGIVRRLSSVNNLQRFLVGLGPRAFVHTQMQVVFNMKFVHPAKDVYDVVVAHGVSAEKLGPGGFRRFLELLVDITNGHTVVPPTVTSRHASVREVEALVKEHASHASRYVPGLLQESLRLAGFAGRIIVEKTSSVVPSVELVRGYGFDLQQLLPIDFSFDNPRIVCIDGYLEQVSEVHHLLEAAAEAKEPCVVFLRGASDDVKHTLKVNYDRGSLKVIPVAVRFDLDGMNTLVDLATITGGDVVSSLKGDLISGVTFSELPRVEQVTMFRGRLVMVGPAATRKSVSVHVANLRRHRADVQVDDLGGLLDRRIRSLSPNHVVVRLPDDRDFVVNSQAIDYALRAVRSATENGVDTAGRPVTTEIAASHHAQRCAATLRELGSVLV